MNYLEEHRSRSPPHVMMSWENKRPWIEGEGVDSDDAPAHAFRPHKRARPTAQQPSSYKQPYVISDEEDEEDEDEVPTHVCRPQKHTKAGAQRPFLYKRPRISDEEVEKHFVPVHVWFGPKDVVTRGLACPFQKFDPKGARCQGEPDYMTPSGGFWNFCDLVDHLKLWHDKDYRCKMCWKILDSPTYSDQGQAELDLHENSGDCSPRPCPQKYWMTEEDKEAYYWQDHQRDRELWYRLMGMLVPRLELEAKYSHMPEPSPEPSRRSRTTARRRARFPAARMDEGEQSSASSPMDSEASAILGDDDDPNGDCECPPACSHNRGPACSQCFEYESALNSASSLVMKLKDHLREIPRLPIKSDDYLEYKIDVANEMVFEIYSKLVDVLPENRLR